MTRGAAGARACALIALALVGLLIAGCGTRDAKGVSVTGVVIAAPAGDAPAAMYATLDNRSGTPDSLLAVSSPAAEHVELHEQMRNGGTVTMEPLSALDIPPRARVRLAPGNVHIMLDDMKHRLAPGDSVPATFRFRHGGDVSVWARVVSYADLERALEAGR